MTDQPDLRMLWIDLETTGLVAEEEVPLELGLILTDANCNEISTFQGLIFEATVEYDERINAAKAHEIVGPMHHKSQLWLDLNTFDSFNRTEITSAALDWMSDNEVRFGTLPMCGSSIGSLDRPFLQYHMRDLYNGFGYRSIDVSSIKEACRRVNPVLAANIKAICERDYGDKEDGHRVLKDCRASIFEYQQYIDNFFFVGDEVL